MFHAWDQTVTSRSDLPACPIASSEALASQARTSSLAIPFVAYGAVRGLLFASLFPGRVTDFDETKEEKGFGRKPEHQETRDGPLSFGGRSGSDGGSEAGGNGVLEASTMSSHMSRSCT